MGMRRRRRFSSSGPAFIVDGATLADTNIVLSNTRASAQTVTDHEGVWRRATTNELCWAGLRRENNICTNADNISSASGWTNSNCTVAANSVEAPDGTMTAHACTVTTITDPWVGRLITVTSNPSTVAGRRFTSSWYIKGVGNTIGKYATLYIYGATGLEGLVTATFKITGSWQRIGVSLAFSSAGVSTQVACRCDFVEGGAAAVVNDVVHLWRPMLQELTGASNTAPSEWISDAVVYNAVAAGVKYYPTTNGNTWNATGVTGTAPIKGFVTESNGTTISNTWTGLDLPKSQTNYMPYSEDLSNATYWVRAGLATPTAETTVRSPDGRTSLWRVIEDTGNSTHALAGQVGTTNTMFTTSIVIAGGTVWGIRFVNGSIAGGNYAYVDVKLSDYSVDGSGAAGTFTLRNYWVERIGLTDKYLVSLCCTTSGSAFTGEVKILLLQSSGVSTYTGASNYVIAGCAMATVADSNGPYIPNLTTGTTARNENTLTATLANLSNGVDQTLLVHFKPYFDPTATWKSDFYDLVKVGTGTTYFGVYHAKTTAQVVGTKTISGSDNTSTVSTAGLERFQQCKMAVRLSGLKTLSVLNGTAGTENSNTTAVSNTSALNFGDAHGLVQRLEIWTIALSQTEMEARTS